jgi:hypothetical protein
MLKSYNEIIKRANRFYDTARFGQPEIRVYHKAGKGKKSPRYLLKCGCCQEKLQIYYADDGLEIGGVNGTITDWREILFPLLLIEHKGGKFRDRSNPAKTKVPTSASRHQFGTRGSVPVLVPRFCEASEKALNRSEKDTCRSACRRHVREEK